MSNITIFPSVNELGLRTEILDKFPNADITFAVNPRGTLVVEIHDVDDAAFYRIRHDMMKVIDDYSSLMRMDIGNNVVICKVTV